jgi:transposase
VPAIPSWLLEPLWDQFAALLPPRPVYAPSHPLGCHRPRIGDRIIFEKLIQVLRFGCSYASIADCACGATTIRERRDEWIKAGIFGELRQIARDAYDRIVGLVLEEIAIDGCIAKAPGGGECAGRSPVDRGKLGMKRSLMVEGRGIPLGRVLAPANRHDSPLLAPTLDKLDDIEPLPRRALQVGNRSFRRQPGPRPSRPPLTRSCSAQVRRSPSLEVVPDAQPHRAIHGVPRWPARVSSRVSDPQLDESLESVGENI